MGGDEFAILCPETSLEGGAAMAEKLRDRLAELTFAREGRDLLGDLLVRRRRAPSRRWTARRAALRGRRPRALRRQGRRPQPRREPRRLRRLTRAPAAAGIPRLESENVARPALLQLLELPGLLLLLRPHRGPDSADVERLARHHGLTPGVAGGEFTKLVDGGKVRVMRHQKDLIFGTVCQFLNLETRQCGIYDGRPKICRDYPGGVRCGFYDFLAAGALVAGRSRPTFRRSLAAESGPEERAGELRCCAACTCEISRFSPVAMSSSGRA